MKRVLLAGANLYNANKGVAALATSSLYLFHKILSETQESFEICVYNHEFRKERDSVLLPDGKRIPFRNIYPTDVFSVRGFFRTLFCKSKLYYLKEFLKCDYVFNISAGDGFSDIYGEDVLIALSRINKLCRLFHKPYYLLPQTYGPFFSRTSYQLAKEDCLSAKLLMSRDRASTDLLVNEFGCKTVLDSIDVAFFLPYRKMKKDASSTHIGINVSETLCSPHNGHKFKSSENYLPILKEAIVQLLSDGYTVHLIPHVADLENTPQNEYFIQYRLWEEIQHPNLIPPPLFLSSMDAKSYISSLDLFIGSRMHACIAAFSSNVPVLLLGYSRKFSGLFQETLDYPYCLDVTSGFSSGLVVNKTKEMIDRLAEIESMIRVRNSTIVKEKTTRLYNTLLEILR